MFTQFVCDEWLVKEYKFYVQKLSRKDILLLKITKNIIFIDKY